MSRRHGRERDYDDGRSDDYNAYGAQTTPYAAASSQYATQQASDPRYNTGSQQAGPNWRWWIPADGISREVIQADIQRYLGPEAVVRPGGGTGENAGVNGYWIAAYRTLTQSMIQDLKADSANWYRDQRRTGGRYEDSMVHRSRQHWGPTGSTPVPSTATTVTPTAAYASDTDPRYASSADPYRTGREDYRSPPNPGGYAAPSQATDAYGRPINQTAQQSQSPDAYYAVAPGQAAAPTYSTSAYGDEYDPRVPRTGDPRAPAPGRASDTRVAGGRSDTQYATGGYSTGSYAANTGQPRQARPGYYIASDGREYPLSQMPTPR